MSKNEEKTTSEQVEQTAPEPEAQQAERPAAPTETQEDPSPEHPQIVVAAPRGLNLREGPHVSYAVKTVLADGAPVEILNLPKDVEVRGWALVEAWDGIGWVNTNFLKEMDP